MPNISSIYLYSKKLLKFFGQPRSVTLCVAAIVGEKSLGSVPSVIIEVLSSSYSMFVCEAAGYHESSYYVNARHD